MSAPPRVPASGTDLDVRHGVETPEHVELRFTLAGLGSRSAAMLLDLLLLDAILLGLGIALSLLFGGRGTRPSGAEFWAVALVILVAGLGFFLYFILFEALGDGRTPGKRALGLRVVLDTGHAVTVQAAILRNIMKVVDLFLVAGPPMMLLHPRHKRLGDLVAGTIVVRDRPADYRLSSAAATAPAEPLESLPPELSDPEYALLARFLARLDDLTPEVRTRLGGDLARRLENRIPRRDTDVEAYLVAVLASERERRRGRLAARVRGEGGSGAEGSAKGEGGRVGRTAVAAERFVARKQGTWQGFQSVAARVAKSGVGALPPDQIPAFAAQYREVAADLARARTYGVDPGVLTYLERLVAAGHNALYRGAVKRRGLVPFTDYLLGEFPAAVVRSWRYVLAAFLVFAIPAAIGYTMLRERPALAEEIVNPEMVSRAEQAADRQARGVGYAQSENEVLPVIAAAIISNNILVCFYAFSGGILAGILTVLSLAYNGLSLGTDLGVFTNHGAASYLLTFVAGHGVLELTAIFISGGAGFRIARALIAPGDLKRADALVLQGRVAVRMIGAVVFLLAIAGSIEGLLSASDAAPAWKLGTSAVTAVLLGLYFFNGWLVSTKQRPAALPGATPQMGREVPATID